MHYKASVKIHYDSATAELRSSSWHLLPGFTAMEVNDDNCLENANLCHCERAMGTARGQSWTVEAVL